MIVTRARICDSRAAPGALWGLCAVIASASACTEESVAIFDPSLDSGKDAAAAATGGAGGEASAGRAGVSSGGSSGAGGASGSTAAGGSAGAATDGGPDGDSGACLPAGAKYVLDICQRLSNPVAVVGPVASTYIGVLHRDCRVARLADEHQNPSEYANRLRLWSLDLWGCQTSLGVTEFLLVDRVNRLSAADAAVLIGHYTDVVSVRVSLSGDEQAKMRKALECLSLSVITNPSTSEHEFSSCALDAGSEAPLDATSTDATSENDGTDGDMMEN